MHKVLTPKEVTKLNFNDLAFFLGISTTDAKWKMALNFYKPEDLEDNLTKTGTPKISVNDLVNKEQYDESIRSYSLLDGKSLIDHTIETYNKGVPLTKLKEFTENKAFIKALKFTGKYSILNSILNKEQLRKVQKHWVLKNTFRVNTWSEKCVKFIESNKWVFDYLVDYNITESDFSIQLEKLQSTKS